MYASKTFISAGAVALAVALCAVGGGGVSAQTATLAPSQMAPADILVTRIDVNCKVVHNAVQSEQPVRLALQHNRWSITTVSDVAVLEKKHASVTLADAYKVDGKYSWVSTHTYTAAGNLRATQLCFRSDGTLARVRQATTVASLDGVAARQAYYNTDGSLIKHSALFEANDTAIVKSVSGLPYYHDLP